MKQVIGFRLEKHLVPPRSENPRHELLWLMVGENISVPQARLCGASMEDVLFHAHMANKRGRPAVEAFALRSQFSAPDDHLAMLNRMADLIDDGASLQDVVLSDLFDAYEDMPTVMARDADRRIRIKKWLIYRRDDIASIWHIVTTGRGGIGGIMYKEKQWDLLCQIFP